MLVVAFFIFICSYFSSLFFAGSPYHGRLPLIKYIMTNPICSKSSLRPYSIPRCVFKLAYLAVPVSCLLSLYGIWRPVRGSLNRFESPKSIIKMFCCVLPTPIRKLSGFISRWRNPHWCIYSILCISYIAIIRTVFRLNLRLQYSNRSSRLGPSKSITITL